MQRLWLVCCLLFIVGCNDVEISSEELQRNAKTAYYYLQERGYKVIAFNGVQDTVYTKESLANPFNKHFWAVQPDDVESFIDVPLVHANFTVENHPLANEQTSEETEITVLLHDGEVIGGTAFPHQKAAIGVPSSIDGKSPEDMKLNYEHWLQNWEKKYE